MGGQEKPDHGRRHLPHAPQPPPFLALWWGSRSPLGGSMRKGARPRRGLWGARGGAGWGRGKRPTGLLGSVQAWAQQVGAPGPQSLQVQSLQVPDLGQGVRGVRGPEVTGAARGF